MKAEDRTIPRDLSYSEEFLLGLSIKHFAYLAFGVILAYLVIFKTDSFIPEFWIRIVLALPIAVLLILLIIFKFDQRIKDQINYKNSVHDSSYFDHSTKSFVELADIDDDIVILKNGVMLAILEITPIDFSILSKDKQDAVMETYQNWFMSIDYPVQILSRSSEVNINNWLNNLENNEHMQKHKSYFKDFRAWINSELESRSVRNRVFYIVIPQMAGIRTRSMWEDVKSIFTGNYSSVRINKDSKQYTDNLKQLLINVRNCEDMLKLCDLKISMLDSSELLGLYTTYFTNSSIINRTLLNPLMWLDKKSTQVQDALWGKIK